MELKNVQEINCKKEENKWTCEIVRGLSAPIKVDNRVCYELKTETIKNLEHIEVQDGKVLECTIQETGTGNMIKCIESK